MNSVIPVLKEVLFSIHWKQWKQKYKGWEFGAQPKFACQGQEMRLIMVRCEEMGAGVWPVCLTHAFPVLLLPPTVSSAFSYTDMSMQSHKLTRWPPWESKVLWLNTELSWSLAKRGNSSTKGRYLWWLTAISLPPTKSKREVPYLLSFSVWTCANFRYYLIQR
jgi:hypothetical protein